MRARRAGCRSCPSSAALSAESGPLYDSDPVPSPEPVRPAVLDSVSVPSETESVRSQTGSSGPASGSWIAIPSPDAVEKARDWLATARTDSDGACKVARRRAETSEVLPWGSVAVAVMIGSPAGAVKGTAKTHLPGRVGRHLQRARGSPGPRPTRRVRSRRWRRHRCGTSCRACCRPASPRAGRRRSVTMIGKFWRLFGPWRGEVPVVQSPRRRRGRWPVPCCRRCGWR